jgi:hypothetical protein
MMTGDRKISCGRLRTKYSITGFIMAYKNKLYALALLRFPAVDGAGLERDGIRF